MELATNINFLINLIIYSKELKSPWISFPVFINWHVLKNDIFLCLKQILKWTEKNFVFDVSIMKQVIANKNEWKLINEKFL